MWDVLKSAAECAAANVTYEHRVQDTENYNFCVVPHSGSDAILLICISILVSCVCSGQLSALYVLLLGGLCQAISLPVNLRQLGNSLALFLGVEPADIFLYAFLPPLLFDASVRIDYFVFKKVLIHVISFAFLIVMASTAIFTPILLYGFGLNKLGWEWQHGALFSAMIASTDAVAVSAILKKGGAPKRLVVLMEGESLFNDATSIVLFEIFFNMVKRLGRGEAGSVLGPWAQAADILGSIFTLAAGGAAIGLAFGLATRLVLKWMHRRGHKAPEQLALTVACAYLSFYVANALCNVSGVIAVVVFGLYGSATGRWHMSPRIVESGTFDIFWDTVTFCFNGLVFFFAGASAINFFWRSSQELYEEVGNLQVLVTLFWRLPLIYLAMIVVRGLCIAAFNPLFRLAKAEMSWPEIVFATMGGLRGAVSLILTQAVVTEQAPNPSLQNQKVTAELALWTAGIVVLTLTVNAPLMPYLLKWTNLSSASPIKVRMRGKAARALVRYTKTAVADLQHDEDEMLRGVDWGAVEEFVDLRHQLGDFAAFAKLEEEDRRKREASALQSTASWIYGAASTLSQTVAGTQVAKGEEYQPLLTQDSLDDIGLERAATARTLSTLEEVENEGVNADSMERGLNGAPAELLRQAPASPTAREMDAANRCAAELLEASNATAAAAAAAAAAANTAVHCNGVHKQAGKIIGAAEGNKELKDRNGGFGAYDCPFLGPTGERTTKDASDEQVADMINGEDDAPEEEEVVLDLEHPSFDDARSQQQHAPQPDLIDELEFGEDGTPLSPGSRHSRPQRQGEAQQPLPSTGQPTAAGPEGVRLRPSPFSSAAETGAAEPTAGPAQPLSEAPEQAGGKDPPAKSPRKGARTAVVPQPIIVPRMIRPGDKEEGQGQQPAMRWVSVGTCQPESSARQQAAADAPRGRTVVRASPGSAAGVSFSFTDTSVPQPGDRRTLESKRRRAQTRALHSALSGPLQQAASAGVESSDNEEAEEDNIEDDLDGQDPEVVAEARVRLVAGLKRYFHEKRAQGLLTGRGILVLDHACDAAMDDSEQPLLIWAIVEREVCGKGMLRWLSRCLFWLRRLNINAGGWRPRFLVRPFIQVPAVRLAELLGAQLSRVMLLAIEVAVEYWLALTWSPQAQWLTDIAKTGIIQDEVKAESAKVWKFIIHREIEAPARFQAIQTHRATMAIIRQQGMFVHQLWSSGMVDETERDALLEPVEKNERRLLRRGAMGRSTMVFEVLRNLPFLRALPGPVFEALLARGNLLKCERGEVIWSPPRPGHVTARGGHGEGNGAGGVGGGIYVVMAGLVRSSYVATDGRTQEYFLGTGSVFGLLSSLVGEALPGSLPCIAVGNALLQGPVLFHFPQSLIDAIRERAASGDLHLRQLELDLLRVAALYLVERLKAEVMAAAATHFQAVAVGQARRRALRRLARHPPGGRKPMLVSEVWARVGGTEKARAVLGEELMRALDAPPESLNSMGGEDGEESKGNKEGKREAAARVLAKTSSFSEVAGIGSGYMPLALECSRSLIADDAAWLQPNVRSSAAAGTSKKEGPTDDEVAATVEPRKIWKRVRKHAAEALAGIKHGLRDADLVQLAPGERLDQGSTWVLLRGSLRTIGHASSIPAAASGMAATREDGAAAMKPAGAGQQPLSAMPAQGRTGNLEVKVAYSGPAVLPWLWHALVQDGEVVLLPQPIPHTAGPNGAVLLACRLDSGDSDESEARSEGASSGDLPSSTPDSGPGSPDRGHSPRAKRASVFSSNAAGGTISGLNRLGRLRALPGDGTGEPVESVGPFHSCTSASKRLRIVSVKRVS